MDHDPAPGATNLLSRQRFWGAALVLLLGVGLACRSGLVGGRETPLAEQGSGNDVLAPANTPELATSTPTFAPLVDVTETVAVTEEATTTPSPSPSPTVTVEPTPELNLAEEQVLILPGDNPSVLDPHLSNDANSLEYVVEIFSGLMAYDPDLNLVPDIAGSYEISGDGLVYTFNIRPEARFHDGKPIRAQDFKWSFERACSPATGSNTADTYLGDIVGCRDKLQGKADQVAGVVTPDDLTLQLVIDEPKGFFLAKMAYPTAYVLDRENVESGGREWSQHPNGSGPFRLEEYVPGQVGIVLNRNDNYYREPQPILAEIRYLLNPPLDLMTGYEQDLSSLGAPEGVSYGVVKLPLSTIERVTKPDNPLSQEVVSVSNFNVDYIGFNVNRPPFDDARIRQALNLALDKRKIVRAAFAGNVTVANGIVPLSMPGYQNPDLSDYEFDLEHALDLIAESSYGSVANLPPITLYTGGIGPIERAIVESYQTNLGLEVALVEAPWLEYLANLSRPDTPYQMYRLGWLADYPDPQNFLEVLFHSQSAQNYGGYSNPKVDELLNQAQGTPDIIERLALYRDVEQMIMDDAALIPLYFEVENWLVKPYVKNFRIPPLKVPKFQYVYIEKH
ncbi:MAG: peptide ABC transporter substrate-binding protein [Anaerolineae bacterium]|nr:peptide ABC transporter substrate-binding protein [Anaerolineae bacterium]